MTGSSLIAQIAAIGSALGFEVDPEHWARSNAETGVYRPRIDCLWAANLSQYGYDTTPLDRLVGPCVASPYGLIGFEVEATDPTTKRQFSNLANLAIAAVPYAVLVVEVSKAKDSFRRANRVVRAFNWRFGHREAAAVDITAVRALADLERQQPLAHRGVATTVPVGGQGGENPRTRALRHHLINVGREAGFEVVCDGSDPRMESSFTAVVGAGARALDVPWSPSSTRQARKFGDLYTDSRPDVVWAVRTGAGLQAVVQALVAQSAGTRSVHQALGPVPALLPVATFELESRMDKHGAGAVLSLGARPGIGILVGLGGSPEGVLRAYRPIVGAGNVVAVEAAAIESL